jgi:HlyD family secretion protein
VVTVTRTDLQITAEATGQLEPIRTVEVKSKASGEVLTVHVDTGDRVDVGTLLVSIDPRDVQNDLNQSQADYDVAQERFNISRSQLRRSEELLAAGVITEQEHEGRNLEFANARAAMVRAQTNLELARLRLQDVTIRSPLVGTVLSKTVEEGVVIQSAAGSVSGGTTLLTVANLDVVQVRTLIDQTDVGRIQAGMAASVRVEAIRDRTFEGKVEKIEPQAVVQQNVIMFPVVVNLDNRDGLLRPGMSAEVQVIIAERPQTLTLPNAAVVTQQEASVAATVLGVPESRAEVPQSRFAELQQELRELRGQGSPQAATEAAPTGAVPAGGARTGGAPAGMPSPEQIRGQMQRGDISPEQLRGMAQQMGGARGGGARGGGRSSDPSAGRPGVVFVRDAAGQLSARAVLTGVNDWNNTEILVGLAEGEEVALVGGAALMARQQQLTQQIQSRMGGGLPFGR